MLCRVTNHHFSNKKTLLTKAGRDRTLTSLMKLITSSLDFGVKVKDEETQKWRIVHVNKKQKIIDAFTNGTTRFLPRLTNEDLSRTWDNKRDFYFAGNSSPKDDFTMFLLDGDCHEWGDNEEAELFLRSLDIPAFVEPSKRGAHGYPILHKEGRGADIINELYRRLQRVLRKKLKAEGWDVEDVEVKGRLPNLQWDNNGKLSKIKLGTLALLPKDRDGFDEWRKQHQIITYTELAQLVVKLEEQFPELRKVKEPTKPIKMKVAGSCREYFFEDEEIAQCQSGGHYYQQWEILTNNQPIRTSGRTVLIAEDGAVMLMILRRLTKDIAPNGGMPWATAAKIWDALYRDGRIRAFDCHRWAAGVRYLKSLGLVDVRSSVYCPGFTDDNGEYHKGFCAKWKLSTKLMEALDWQHRERTLERLTGQVSFLNGEKRKHTTGTNLFLPEEWDKFTRQLVQTTPKEWIQLDQWVRNMSSLDNLIELAA